MVSSNIISFKSEVKKLFNTNDSDILEKIFSKILIITDLKLDDNLAILELVRILKEKKIPINIDIIVTSIKNNNNKMINNLIFYDTTLKDYVNKGITFYEGKVELREKRHERFIEEKNIVNINIYKWEELLDKEIDYSICFGFAPIQQFTESKNGKLFSIAKIVVLGHGYNTDHEENGKINNEKTKLYMDKISEMAMVICMNNNTTFDIRGGKIYPNINNKYIKEIFKNFDNNHVKEILDQGKSDEASFITDTLFKVYEKLEIKKKYNNFTNNYVSNEINNVFTGKTEESYIKNIISDMLNIIGNNEKYEKERNKLEKCLTSLNNPNIKIEVTDWSQMKLLLDIFINDNFEGDIENASLKVQNGRVEFITGGKIYHVHGLKWSKFEQ